MAVGLFFIGVLTARRRTIAALSFACDGQRRRFCTRAAPA
jgi:hypothetical protein